ncbi:MAG TPA: FecR domain-containing protein [Candidatus Paceibacterota bacterium]|nr:FecR domain-containing protein [Verrucomicrobiota bacterium]HRZ45595.1 FecR domain-containing protein [Candidatus Paceibacterota bacterium]HRZ91402.1 FecR domain-containing protein [Candidatus Paceibacterota bacterium]
MKHVGNLFSGWAVRGVAVAFTVLAISVYGAPQPGQAVVTAVKGVAQYQVPGGAWTALHEKDVLAEGTVIKTESDSSVDLDLKKNGKFLRIMANTVLTLEKLNFDETGVETVFETRHYLANGRILGELKKNEVSKYFVRKPDGVVAIRGCRFDIEYPGSTRIYEGSAFIRYTTPQGKTYDKDVNEGEVWVPPVDPEGEPSVVPMDPSAVWPLQPRLAPQDILIESSRIIESGEKNVSPLTSEPAKTSAPLPKGT